MFTVKEILNRWFPDMPLVPADKLNDMLADWERTFPQGIATLEQAKTFFRQQKYNYMVVQQYQRNGIRRTQMEEMEDYLIG